MKDLTGPAQQAKEKLDGVSPVNILVLELPSPAGVKRYSDRDFTLGSWVMEGRVVDWGDVLLPPTVQALPLGSFHLSLDDNDFSLSELVSQVSFQGSRAQIYTHFEGNSLDDLVVIFEGVIESVGREEGKGTCQIELVDLTRGLDRPVGTVATKELFGDIDEGDEGRLLPVVYGRVRRARAVFARAGRRGVLLNSCADSDTTLYISGFEDLPSGTELKLRIGIEEMVGTISGIVFTVTERGRVICSGHVTDETNEYASFIDTALGGIDDEYVGYVVRMWVPGYNFGGAQVTSIQIMGSTPAAPQGRYERVWITRYDASSGKIEYTPSFMQTLGSGGSADGFVYNTIGRVFMPPRGWNYDILSQASAHEAGEEVRQVLDSYVYVANDAPSRRVRAVYVKGRGRLRFRASGTQPLSLQPGPLGTATRTPEGDETVEPERDVLIPLPPELWNANTNDSTTFPSIDHAVTTIHLVKPPSFLRGLVVREDELLVDLDGVPDGQGSYISNPAEVLKDAAMRFCGLSSGELDSDSFDDAASKMGALRFSFALNDLKLAREFLAELSFQARSSLGWRDGKLRIRYLTNFGAPPAATVTADHVVLDSVDVSWSEMASLVTEVHARWTGWGEEKGLVVRDAQAESAYGRRKTEIFFWGYSDRTHVANVAGFWLSRWKRVRKTVKLRTFLQKLELERGDPVELNVSPHFDSQLAVVDGLSHVPGSGRDGRPDRIELTMALPVWPGCSTSCEAECQTGCESACELGCQTGCELSCELVCEDGCQALCEVVCVTAVQNTCADGCQTSCTIGCEFQCTGQNMIQHVSCDTSCESICESTGCETSCTAWCVNCCQAGCEVWCQSSCTSMGCETACQGSGGCETACEAACETGCEIDCEASCELECEMGQCESMEVCTVCCMVACTGSSEPI